MGDGPTSIVIESGERAEKVHSEPTFRPPFWSFARKFCMSTSLHGFQYIGDRTRPSWERLCWLVAVCLSVAACFTFIFRAYSKWVTVPIYVTFAETSTSINEIPFPAVTICPGNKVRKQEFDIKADLDSNAATNFPLYDDILMKKVYSELLCRRYHVYGGLYNEYKVVDEKAVQFIEKVGYDIGDFIQGCRWRNLEMSCRDIFTSVLTDAGLCYTFNIINSGELLNSEVDGDQFKRHLNHNRTSSEWSLEGGYKTDEADFPFRTSSSGSLEGLSFLYREQENDLVDSCGIPSFGFQVLIHSPVNFPSVSPQFFLVPSGHDVVIGLQANIIGTSSKLQAEMTPLQRRCFMSYERKLFFFRVYTEENCEFECFINETQAACNCSAFYMPRIPDTPLCGPGNHACLDNALARLHHNEREGKSACHCLPSCTEIQYDTEVSQSKMMWSKSQLRDRLVGIEIGRMSIYFKRSRFIPSRRSELYGLTDFIANCGGLLGLFLGFSFLSLVEVGYFLLMRPVVGASRTLCKSTLARPVKTFP